MIIVIVVLELIQAERELIVKTSLYIVLDYVCMLSHFRNVITCMYVFNACAPSGHALAGYTVLRPDKTQAVKLSKSGGLARLHTRCKWEAEHDAEKGQRLTRMRDDARSRRDAEAVYIVHGVAEWPRWL